MPKMTKAQSAKLAKLRANLEAAHNAVFAVAHPRRDIRFSDCMAMAPETVRDAFRDAEHALSRFETQMALECRAYRGTFGTLIPY